MQVISRYCLFSEIAQVLREHFVKMNGVREGTVRMVRMRNWLE